MMHELGADSDLFVLQEFYYHLQPRDRPHIFGMTASPVNVGASQSLDRVPATIAELEPALMLPGSRCIRSSQPNLDLRVLP
jgi:hypothetical protein